MTYLTIDSLVKNLIGSRVGSELRVWTVAAAMYVKMAPHSERPEITARFAIDAAEAFDKAWRERAQKGEGR